MDARDRPVLTDPLTKSELARWWRISRNRVDAHCQRIPGAQRCGIRWMVPLYLMPLRYWFDTGIVDRQEFSRQAALHCAQRLNWPDRAA